MLISVVIPTLNEAARIEDCLRQFEHQPGEWELIVVDGQSGDETALRATAMGASVISTEPGRGPQMNAGAAAAQGTGLLFLHADARLPPHAHQRMSKALDDVSVALGCFRVRHEAERWKGSWKSGLLRLADLRSHYTSQPYGDQGLFVRKLEFQKAGGFPNQPLMEEMDLVRRCAKQGRIVTLNAEIMASGRRFEFGFLQAWLCMMCFPWLYRLGVSTQRLAKLYGHPR